MSKTCLIVSPYFPPSSLAGVHRTRHLAKHLPAAGWHPLIVAVHEDCYDHPPDHTLAALMPTDLEVTKVNAIPSAVSRLAGVGDISLRAYQTLQTAIDNLIRRHAPKVVMITGSPYFPMMFAPRLRRVFGVPVVLDFQDPWVSSWGETQPRLSKRGLSHMIASNLEPIALGAASFVTSVSERQNEELRARYPWLDAARMAAIPIGGDSDDFQTLRSHSLVEGPERTHPSSEYTIAYVGTIWPAVAPTVDVLIGALTRIRDRAPSIFSCLRLQFVGSSANPRDLTGYKVLPLAAAAGVGSIVEETPQRVAYGEALRAMAAADANLVLGSMEPHYTASKLFPILMSGTKYISLLHRDSSAHALALRAGGGRALAFSTPAELAALECVVADTIVELVTHPQSCGGVDPAAYAPFEARNISQRFAGIFEEISR